MSGLGSEQSSPRLPLSRKLVAAGKAAIRGRTDGARATVGALRSHVSPQVNNEDPLLSSRRRTLTHSNSSNGRIGDTWGAGSSVQRRSGSHTPGMMAGEGMGTLVLANGKGISRLRKGYLLMMREGGGGGGGVEWLERFFYLSGHFLRYKKHSLNLTSVNLKQ
ncbi:unnamed protein product, partial [Choristocarpus tenellus]